MSVYPIWIVCCSADGAPIDFDQHGETLAQSRANARAEGWKTGRGKYDEDWCPKHLPTVGEAKR